MLNFAIGTQCVTVRVCAHSLQRGYFPARLIGGYPYVYQYTHLAALPSHYIILCSPTTTIPSSCDRTLSFLSGHSLLSSF
jgi:hypothetical protein